jgi:hypothetical protein
MTVHGGRSRADRRGRSVIDTECRNRECLRASGPPPARSACGRGVVLIARPRDAAGRVPRRIVATRPAGGGVSPRMSRWQRTRLVSTAEGPRHLATGARHQDTARPPHPVGSPEPRPRMRAGRHGHSSFPSTRAAARAQEQRQYFPCKKLPTRRTPSLQLLAFCLVVGGRLEPTPAVGASR